MLLDNTVFTLSFDIDGNHLVANNNTNTTIWRLDKEWRRYNWEMVNAISPDRKMMLSALNCPPKELCQVTVRILDVITKKDIFHTVIVNGPVDNITFSRNGEFFAISDSNDVVHVWKISTRKEVSRIKSPIYITNMVFSPDGNLLATGSYDNMIRVWDAQSGNLILSLPNSGNIFDFSPDGKLLGIGGFDNNINIWNIPDNYWSITMLNDVKIARLIFSPDGKFLATNGDNDKSVRIWNVSTGQEMVRLFQDGTITTLTFDSSGKLLATGGNDKIVRVWDISNGEEIARLLHDGSITTLAFSSDGKLLATGSQDKTARVWDVLSGQELGRMLHDYQVSLVAFNPSEKMIISSSNTTRIWLWSINDLISEACKRTPRNFTYSEWIYYFPDEKYRATCPNLPVEAEPTVTPTQ
jgi:WD40 repeat protein